MNNDSQVSLGNIAKKYNLWLHADCAWGGAVIFSDKYKYLMDGCEMLDSVAYNPHKMLGAPLQASLFMTKHREILHQTNCAASTYLFQQDKFYDVTAGNYLTFKQISIPSEILARIFIHLKSN